MTDRIINRLPESLHRGLRGVEHIARAFASPFVSGGRGLGLPGDGSDQTNPLDLIELQRELQQEQLSVQLTSNTMQAEHEARMSVVRNIKA